MASKAVENKFKIQCDWFVNTNEIIITKSQTTGVISARLRKIEERYKLLSEAYEAILNSVTDEKEIVLYDTQFRNAEEIYYQFEAISSAYPNLDGTHQPTESAQNARLPTINLSVYDGDIFGWTSFISLFNSLVMSRKDISKTEKFHYLFSNVQKEPRDLIKHLPMVDESLDTAMDILKSRYENKRLLSDSHISRVLNLPCLNNITGLRTKILNPLLESTRALNNLGFPINEWSYLLLYIGLTKLPLDMKSRFDHKYGGNTATLPSFNQLIDFLQNECRLLDTATSDSINNNNNNYSDRGRRAPRAGLVTHNNNVVATKRCLYCQFTGHTIFECYKFNKLSNNGRKDFIKDSHLCFKCFGQHNAGSCNSKVPCNKCGNIGHNKLICMMHISRAESPARHAFIATSSDRGYQLPNRFSIHSAAAGRRVRSVSPHEVRDMPLRGEPSSRAHAHPTYDSPSSRYQRRIDNNNGVSTDAGRSRYGPQDVRNATARDSRHQCTNSE